MTTRSEVIEATIKRVVPAGDREFVLGVLRKGNEDKAERIVRNWIEKNPLKLEPSETSGLLTALDSVGAVAASSEANTQPLLF